MAVISPLRTDTKARVEAQIQGKGDAKGAIFKILLQLGLLMTIVILGVLLAQVISDGWGVLADRGTGFLSATLRSQADEAGVAQGLRGTMWIGILVVVISFPLGIAAALYLEEYASKNKLTSFIELNIRNLAGVPAVVYGILGFSIFVKALDGFTGGRTVLAGGITMAILVLPIVIITASEAVRAVPQSLREAGYGVGATKWEVIRSHVLPYAAPGILTGTLLSLSRALGEAAPLILVGAVTGRLGQNSGYFDVGQLQERFTAMPIVIASWSQRPQREFLENAAAAIIVLLVIVLLANATAILLRNRYEKKRS
ncbi:MAG: phosphate ABC transporter permease PstA [Acidimicrobiia bacterium]|nr:phosphate ABC transporter permease PstA [Acidimicrobiia bacterium]